MIFPALLDIIYGNSNWFCWASLAVAGFIEIDLVEVRFVEVYFGEVGLVEPGWLAAGLMLVYLVLTGNDLVKLMVAEIYLEKLLGTGLNLAKLFEDEDWLYLGEVLDSGSYLV